MEIKISIEKRVSDRTYVVEQHRFIDPERAIAYLDKVYDYHLEIDKKTFAGCKFHDKNDEWIIIKPASAEER